MKTSVSIAGFCILLAVFLTPFAEVSATDLFAPLEDEEDDFFFKAGVNLSEIISGMMESTLAEFKRNPGYVVKELVKVLDKEKPQEQGRQYGSQLFTDLFSLSSKIMALHKAIQENDMMGVAKVFLKDTPFYAELDPRSNEVESKHTVLTTTIHRIASFLVPSITIQEVSTCLGLFEKIAAEYYSYNKVEDVHNYEETSHEEL